MYWYAYAYAYVPYHKRNFLTLPTHVLYTRIRYECVNDANVLTFSKEDLFDGPISGIRREQQQEHISPYEDDQECLYNK